MSFNFITAAEAASYIKEKGMTEDEMVGCHRRLKHEFE